MRYPRPLLVGCIAPLSILVTAAAAYTAPPAAGKPATAEAAKDVVEAPAEAANALSNVGEVGNLMVKVVETVVGGAPVFDGPRGQTIEQNYETLILLSRPDNPAIPPTVVEQLGRIAGMPDRGTRADVLRTAALYRLLELSCGKPGDSRLTYAAADAIYGARVRTGPLLSTLLTPESSDYFRRSGRLILVHPQPGGPARCFVIDDEIVTAALIRTMGEGLISGTGLAAVNPAEFAGLVRLLTAAAGEHTASTVIRHAALKRLEKFSELTAVAPQIPFAHYVATSPYEPEVAVVFLKILAVQATVAEADRPGLASEFTAIAKQYENDPKVLAALTVAVAKMQTLYFGVPAAPDAVTGSSAEKPADPAATTNPFFVSTEVQTVNRIVGVADKDNKIGATFGPRPRFDPRNGRPPDPLTIPQNQQAGRRLRHDKLEFPGPFGSVGGAKGASGATR